MALNEGRQILNLPDDELEELIKKWIANELSIYDDFERPSGSGDRGLDAVGFYTPQRYDDAWDNYQCKQLKRHLDLGQIYKEIGKVLYYTSRGEFSPPNKYIFVAPKGVTGPARILLGSPKNFKKAILQDWDINCSNKIIANKKVAMDSQLEGTINNFDFSKIEGWNVHKLIEQPELRKILHNHVDYDPGMAPKGKVPKAVTTEERPYIDQLIATYAVHLSLPLKSEIDVQKQPAYWKHLNDQRRRYYDAKAFQHHFRDNLSGDVLEQFNLDIYDGVVEDYNTNTGYDRVNVVLKTAGSLNVSGIFEKHRRAPISVKQGTCHHLANEGTLPWK